MNCVWKMKENRLNFEHIYFVERPNSKRFYEALLNKKKSECDCQERRKETGTIVQDVIQHFTDLNSSKCRTLPLYTPLMHCRDLDIVDSLHSCMQKLAPPIDRLVDSSCSSTNSCRRNRRSWCHTNCI